MRSVRLDGELDEMTRRAAAMEGSTMSEFMRRAIAERAQRILSTSPEQELADVIGAVHGGGGGHARDTGAAFTELIGQSRSERP